jgi:hypothetical protein
MQPLRVRITHDGTWERLPLYATMIREHSSAATNACHFSSPRLNSTLTSRFSLVCFPLLRHICSSFCFSRGLCPVLSFDLPLSLYYSPASYITLLLPLTWQSPHSLPTH